MIQQFQLKLFHQEMMLNKFFYYFPLLELHYDINIKLLQDLLICNLYELFIYFIIKLQLIYLFNVLMFCEYALYYHWYIKFILMKIS